MENHPNMTQDASNSVEERQKQVLMIQGLFKSMKDQDIMGLLKECFAPDLFESSISGMKRTNKRPMLDNTDSVSTHARIEMPISSPPLPDQSSRLRNPAGNVPGWDSSSPQSSQSMDGIFSDSPSSSPPSSPIRAPSDSQGAKRTHNGDNIKASSSSAAARTSAPPSSSPTGLMASRYASHQPASLVALGPGIQGRLNTPHHTKKWKPVSKGIKSNARKIKSGDFHGQMFTEVMKKIHESERDYIYFLNDMHMLQKGHPECDPDVVDALANCESKKPHLARETGRLFPPENFWFCFGMYKGLTLDQVNIKYIQEQFYNNKVKDCRPWFEEAARLYLAHYNAQHRFFGERLPLLPLESERVKKWSMFNTEAKREEDEGIQPGALARSKTNAPGFTDADIDQLVHEANQPHDTSSNYKGKGVLKRTHDGLRRPNQRKR